jgi:hypothetical protein
MRKDILRKISPLLTRKMNKCRTHRVSFFLLFAGKANINDGSSRLRIDVSHSNGGHETGSLKIFPFIHVECSLLIDLQFNTHGS